jgi:hypothetical protein
MKIAVLLACVLFQSAAWAGDPAPVFTQDMRLDNTDARLLFSSMPVSIMYGSDETGPFMKKSLQIGPMGIDGHELTLSATCELLAGGDLATCALTWITQIELKAGVTVHFSQSVSQAIVSRLGLLARPRLGQGWSGLDFSPFGIQCMEAYTPTDLPIYTACSLSVAR